MRLVEELAAPGIGSIMATNTDPASERVGTGPFREVEYVPEQHYIVEANDTYWGDDGAQVVRIRFVFYPDPATRLLALQAGEADLNIEVDRQAAGDLGGDVRLLMSPMGGYQAIGLNLNGTAPFDLLQDIDIRRAIAHAIDQAAIVEGAWLGNAGINTTLAPAAIFGDAAESIGSIPYDPAEARRLLDEAGWVDAGSGIREKDGRALSLTLVSGYPTTTEQGSTAELIQAMLHEIGIDMEIVSITDRAAYAELLGEGRGDLWLEAAGQDDGSPIYIFYTMTGDNAWGWAFTAGPEFEATVDAAKAAPTFEESQQFAAEAMSIALVEVINYIPVAGFSRLWGASNRVGEVIPHPSRYSQR